MRREPQPRNVSGLLCGSMWLVVAVVTAGAGGCSRLDFVRPDPSRKGETRVAPKIDVRDQRAGLEAVIELQRAQHALASGDAAQAQEHAKRAVKQAPRSAEAQTLLAMVLEAAGEARQAGRHYQRAVELAPARGEMLNNYGAWLCGQGRARESLEWFDRALAALGYATPASALANAGACAARAGDRERAERDLRQAVELDPANAVALAGLARHEFESGRYLAARAFSERRLSAAPADAGVLLLASQIEEKLGDSAAAARYVQRMRAEFPDERASEAGEEGRR